MYETRRTRLVAYGIAVLGPALTLLLRSPFDAVLGERVQYMAFYPTVLLAAFFGGLWPGLLATVLSSLAATYFLVDLGFSLEIAKVQDAVALGFFVVVSVAVSALSETRLRSQRRIAASERRYAVTLASIGDAVIATDTHARVTFLNAAAEGLTGWRLAEAVGMPLDKVFCIINEQTRQPVEDPAAKVLRSGTKVGLANHTALVSRDGRELAIDDCGAPIIDDRGAIAGVVLVFRDVSQRREAEKAEAFRQANARFELAIRGSSLAIWEYDFPGGVLENSHPTFINVWESLGYDASTAPTDFVSAFGLLLHPDDQERVRREIQEVFAVGGREFESEYRVRSKAGSTLWHLARGTVFRDREGKPARFIGSSVAITERKQAEEALRENEAMFRGTFENAAVGIDHVDLEGRFLRINQKFCEILGYTHEELFTKTWMELTHPDDLAADLELYGRLLRGELASYTLEKRFIRNDRSSVWVHLTVSFMRDAAGRPAYCIAIFEDISERKRLDTELRQAKEAAEAANRAKDEFLANVSHEIRTPMNAILGMTELTLDTELTQHQRQCLLTVKSAADNLLGIINDLLDFAKIEAGKLELDPTDFSLRLAIGDTLRALGVRADKKGVELIYDVDPAVPDDLIGDAVRLRQVVLNLVGNAIKFTDSGEVVVQVQAEHASDPLDRQQAILRFIVRDTGIGIPLDKQATVFRPFEQEDASTTRKHGGTGLGLTIAAQLVALMGGQISINSSPGEGSTFAFTARFGLQPHPTESDTVQAPVLLRNLPVLVIDDNATNREILLQCVRGWDMDAAVAGDAVAAMGALLEAAARGRPYPLVLLDARMPDTDGLALAAQIRKRAELCGTRIILLSSGDRPGDSDRTRGLRIEAHLLKPIQKEELLDMIHQVMARTAEDELTQARSPSGEEIATAPVSSSRALDILLAEDDEFSARFMQHLLARHGHRMRLTANGREALSLAENDDFDLVLLDIHMPELDGFDVVKRIRERERASGGHLPVIALTARSRQEDREHCLAAGMDDFLTKPIAPADLLTAIDRMISRQPPDWTSEDPQQPTGLLDPVALLKACGDDADAMRRMCGEFEAYAPVRLAEVADAVRDRNAPRLRQAAHKFCPLLLAFSTIAGNVASDLEDLAAQDRIEESQPMVEKLSDMTDEIMRAIAGLSIKAVRAQASARRLA
jgi:two-component system, sensor histidine kinase and response regulator